MLYLEAPPGSSAVTGALWKLNPQAGDPIVPYGVVLVVRVRVRSSYAKAPSVTTLAPMKSTDKSRSSCVLPQHSKEGPLPRAASIKTVWIGVVTLFPLLPAALREARLRRASSVAVVRWVSIWLPTKGLVVDQSPPRLAVADPAQAPPRGAYAQGG